jgi:hypothetical protein
MSDTPERCTCGSVLVEDARFCHRCGRPIRELTAVEQEELSPAPPPPAPKIVIPPQPLPIGFGNPIALRVAFLMSLGIMMAEMLPIAQYLFFAWWLLAGWGGVRLYRRMTGLRLTVPAGARLGSLTGLFAFVSMAVVFSLTMASSTGRDMLDQMVKQDPRMSEVVSNPTMLGAVLLMVLIMVFAMVVGICAAGGALGAKLGTPASPPTESRT